MFITNPSFQQWVSEYPESQYWRAVILSTGAPWYLLRHRMSTEEGSFVQSTAVTCESVLMDIAGQLGPDGVLSLSRLSSSTGAWALREISEVWVAADDEATRTGPLVLQMKDESFLRDCHDREVGPRQGRRLLLRTRDGRVAADRLGDA
jgi:hypothetical protein